MTQESWKAFVLLQEAAIKHSAYTAMLRAGCTLDEIEKVFDPRTVAETLRKQVMGNRTRFADASDRRQIWEATVRWCAQELDLVPTKDPECQA